MPAEKITPTVEQPSSNPVKRLETTPPAEPIAVGCPRGLWLAMGTLVLCFAVPLYRLFKFALGDQLYSYIVLLPFVSAYLVYLKKPVWPVDPKPLRGLGALLVAGGALLAAWQAFGGSSRPALGIQDELAVIVLGFFLCFAGVLCLFLDGEMLRGYLFPIGFLIFMVPMPVAAKEAIENFLQHGSALAADWMFSLSGMPFLRNDLIIQLPGIKPLQVAPECSGIHSSWILLITSLLAGYLFLRSPWKRGILTLAVVPLALLRNGFRIYTIGELCVHVSPDMIDSPVHTRGGPVFFALSLIPFLILLAWMHRSENRGRQIRSKAVKNT